MRRKDIFQEALEEKLQQQTRRNFLKESFMGLGGLALGGFLSSCGGGLEQSNSSVFDLSNPLMARAPHFAPKARSVIYIHMAGAPSQL